jgi:hypothetical protein
MTSYCVHPKEFPMELQYYQQLIQGNISYGAKRPEPAAELPSLIMTHVWVFNDAFSTTKVLSLRIIYPKTDALKCKKPVLELDRNAPQRHTS